MQNKKSIIPFRGLLRRVFLALFSVSSVLSGQLFASDGLLIEDPPEIVTPPLSPENASLAHHLRPIYPTGEVPVVGANLTVEDPLPWQIPTLISQKGSLLPTIEPTIELPIKTIEILTPVTSQGLLLTLGLFPRPPISQPRSFLFLKGFAPLNQETTCLTSLQKIPNTA
jgi:hypothetical protein